MFWFPDDEDDPPPTKALEIVRKIRLLKSRRSMITLPEGEELNRLELELEKVRETCNHTYRVSLMFNRHRRWCIRCDKEDLSYKHQE